MSNIIKKVLLTIPAVFLGFLIVFVLWVILPYSVMDEAEEAMSSDAIVTIEENRNIVFKPAKGYHKGLIIYPGTRVNSEAYSVLARDIAEGGILVVLAQMPLDLSVLDIDRADKIIENYPEVTSWSISGHSMGGAMAAFYTNDNRDKIDGLIMLASYPSESTNLSDSNIKVLSLYGSEDRIATEQEVMEKKHLFPSDIEYFKINGGNHAGFGYYGDQKGDGEHIISREEQHNILSSKITSFINSL